MADVVAARITIPVTTDAGKASIDIDKASASITNLSKSTNTLAASQNTAAIAAKKTSNASQLLSTGFILAAAGAALITKTLTHFITEAEASQKVNAQLNQVLKSTGGIAGLTAIEVQNMATELQSVTTFADDVIQSGQNLLLTFTRIGKDVFPQASEAMLDMATVLGTSVQGAAIQLGKALNDPIQGVTALQRAGVQLSASQKEQIKGYMAVGNVAAAQKVILGELATQMGGSARAATQTMGGAFKQLQNTTNDLYEKVGLSLAPSITALMKAMTGATGEGGALGTVLYMVGFIASKVVGLLAMVFQKSNIKDIQTQVEALQEKNNKLLDSMARAKQGGNTELMSMYAKKIGETRIEIDKLLTKQTGMTNAMEKTGESVMMSIDDFRKLGAEVATVMTGVRKQMTDAGLNAAQMAKAWQIAFASGDFSAGMKLLKQQMAESVLLVAKSGGDVAKVKQYYQDLELKASKDFMVQQAGNEQLSFDERRRRLDNANAQIQASTVLSNQNKIIAQQDYQAQVDILDQAYYAKMLSNVQLFATGATMIMDIAKGIMGAMNAADQQDIENMQEKIRLEDQAISRKDAIVGKTQEEIDKMNARWAEEDAIAQKQKDLRKKQAIQTKAMGIFQAIINTAMAVAGMLAANPIGPWNFVFAALAGIKGAVEIGVIASQPIPSAAFGGQFMVPPGNEADSGLLKVSSGEDVSVTPARNSGSGPQRVTVTIGARDFEGYFAEMTDKVLNSGKVQIRRSGVVKFA